MFIYSISIYVPGTGLSQGYMVLGINKFLVYGEVNYVSTVLLINSEISAILEECYQVEKAQRWKWPTWIEVGDSQGRLHKGSDAQILEDLPDSFPTPRKDTFPHFSLHCVHSATICYDYWVSCPLTGEGEGSSGFSNKENKQCSYPNSAHVLLWG